jgi:hypothetical protein
MDKSLYGERQPKQSHKRAYCLIFAHVASYCLFFSHVAFYCLIFSHVAFCDALMANKIS